MRIFNCKQLSPEWFQLRAGKVSGTKFGAVISGRQNSLVYELLNETLNGYVEQEDYISADMEYGIEHEEEARQLYSKMSGIAWAEVGAILSDLSIIHMASPDGICGGKVLEIKCTMHGEKHIKRFFQGVDTEHLAQCINYFAVSDEVTEVHYVSYCPFRPERPLIATILTRDTVIDYTKHKEPLPITIQDKVIIGRAKIKEIEADLEKLETEFLF